MLTPKQKKMLWFDEKLSTKRLITNARKIIDSEKTKLNPELLHIPFPKKATEDDSPGN